MVMLAYYYGLISHFGLGRSDSAGLQFNPMQANLQFNSMLDHLLQGRCDVDPNSVGIEGYARDGRVYAYWGIVPALLRLVLLPIPGWRTLDVTAASCAVAATLGGVLNIAAIREVHRHVPASAFATTLAAALTVSVLFGGTNVQYLRASVYQEVAFWAAAFGSAFVLFSVRGLVRETGFSAGLLGAMGGSAALALLTRVTTGLGLYVALGLLLLWLAARHGGVMQRRFVAAVALLLAGVVAAGVVNAMRFGSPLVFQNVAISLANAYLPDRLPRLEQYGIFGFSRIWYGLLYYFVPVWFLIRPDGRLLFAETDQRLMEATEMPPSSFFATDLILLALLAALLWILLRPAARVRTLDVGALAAVLGGLAIPALLMLMFSSFNFRYRMEFYPLFDLGAYMGFFVLASGVRPPRPRWPNLTWPVWAATAIGVVTSHAVLLLYQLSNFGPARIWLDQSHADWSHVYYWRIARLLGL
jgi:hypothetical protein